VAYTPTNKPGPPAHCLVTGLGRTGTLFTASVLNAAGWEINHDDKNHFCMVIVIDRIWHTRGVPLVPTPARLKRCHAGDPMACLSAV
jgi:hypothetical protein